MISQDTVFGADVEQGFAGLTFHTGDETLMKLSTEEATYWGSVGNISGSGVSDKIPFKNVGAQLLADEVKLYAVI